MEEWKDIKGYEGLYQVSNWGNVRSVFRYVKSGNGYRKVRERILKTYLAGLERDYHYINLHKNNKKEPFSVHRLVAEAFIPNSDNLPQVNHKDEDKTNNKVENLEWCTSQYNNTYNDRHLKCANKVKESNTIRSGKPINQYDKDGILIATYPSAWEASRKTGFTKQGIMIACHGGQMKGDKWVKSLQYKGYIWKYA